MYEHFKREWKPSLIVAPRGRTAVLWAGGMLLFLERAEKGRPPQQCLIRHLNRECCYTRCFYWLCLSWLKEKKKTKRLFFSLWAPPYVIRERFIVNLKSYGLLGIIWTTQLHLHLSSPPPQCEHLSFRDRLPSRNQTFCQIADIEILPT